MLFRVWNKNDCIGKTDMNDSDIEQIKGFFCSDTDGMRLILYTNGFVS